MHVVTADEMRALERWVARKFGIGTLTLMEHAGLRVVELIERQLPEVAGKDIVILAGKGSNGGDGLAAARLLANAGARPTVFLTARRATLRGDPRVNLGLLPPSVPVTEFIQPRQLRDFKLALQRSDLVIDALFGTGLSRPIAGLPARLIEAVNLSGRPVLSVDLPSGVHADTGAILGSAVRARWTVTLGLPKRGVVLHPGAEHAGELYVGELGWPGGFAERSGSAIALLTPEAIHTLLPVRKPTAHKGDAGRVLIVGGSAGMAGAVFLSARAALRAGAGLVTMALPASLNLAAKSAVVEAMTVPLSETSHATIAEAARAEVTSHLERLNALAVGPGMTRHLETASFVRSLLARVRMPIVLDADAIVAWSGHVEALRRTRAPKVLTPHPGELSELLGVTTESIAADRIGIAQQAARACHAVVVLKGARTVVADADGTAVVNLTGNSAMATGGAGDVLTGLIAALLAQGLRPFDAAAVGVHLHGQAGDLAADTIGPVGIVAGDLIDYLPSARNRVGELAGPSGAGRLHRLC